MSTAGIGGFSSSEPLGRLISASGGRTAPAVGWEVGFASGRVTALGAASRGSSASSSRTRAALIGSGSTRGRGTATLALETPEYVPAREGKARSTGRTGSGLGGGSFCVSGCLGVLDTVGRRGGAELRGTADRDRVAPNRLWAKVVLVGGAASHFLLFAARDSASSLGLSFTLCRSSKGDSDGTTARPWWPVGVPSRLFRGRCRVWKWSPGRDPGRGVVCGEATETGGRVATRAWRCSFSLALLSSSSDRSCSWWPTHSTTWTMTLPRSSWNSSPSSKSQPRCQWVSPMKLPRSS